VLGRSLKVRFGYLLYVCSRQEVWQLRVESSDEDMVDIMSNSIVINFTVLLASNFLGEL
jgi:hypothetical protein